MIRYGNLARCIQYPPRHHNFYINLNLLRYQAQNNTAVHAERKYCLYCVRLNLQKNHLVFLAKLSGPEIFCVAHNIKATTKIFVPDHSHKILVMHNQQFVCFVEACLIVQTDFNISTSHYFGKPALTHTPFISWKLANRRKLKLLKIPFQRAHARGFSELESAWWKGHSLDAPITHVPVDFIRVGFGCLFRSLLQWICKRYCC